MNTVVLIADTRDVVRTGLKNIFIEDSTVSTIIEASSWPETQEQIHSHTPDLVLIHQTLISCTFSLPRERFIILATDPDEGILLEAQEHGARGYLLESSSLELIKMAVSLPKDAFLLDPTLTPQLLQSMNKKRVPITKNHGLTIREQEIFELLRKGLTNRAIGQDLCISETTVKTHVASIFRKLDIKRRYLTFSTALC